MELRKNQEKKIRKPSLKGFLVIGIFFILVAIFTSLFLHLKTPETLNLSPYQKGGENALSDLSSIPSVSLEETDDSYIVEDVLSEGIQIEYPNQEKKEEDKPKTKVSLPKDYSKPIEVKLDDQRIITIQDEDKDGYSSSILSEEQTKKEENNSFFSRIFPNQEESTNSYLKYQKDRKTLLYTYQRDRANGERKLKHWTLYEKGTGEEKETYTIENAKLKINEEGAVELFYFGEQDMKNEAAAKEVPEDLMARAQRTIQKEMGNDILNGSKNPDLLIPKPYYYDKDGNYHEAEWTLEENRLSLNIKTTKDLYPISLDPTLQFTVPGIANGGSVIEGEATSQFGRAMVSGDLNADGKIDLAVGAPAYSTSTGRVYIFYNDGAYATQSASADTTITGEGTNDEFGGALAVGDLNADGKTDLMVGAPIDGTDAGKISLFYNDGSYPELANNADVRIDAESDDDFAGTSLATGDFNADGKTDVAIGAYGYVTNTGRVYILYNDGAYPTNVNSADVTITGENTSDQFGTNLLVGDFNSDTKTDLAVVAEGYSTQKGRVYLFHNDGSIPTTAATADVIISGSANTGSFGRSMVMIDINLDGEEDLVVGAHNDTNSTGKVYVFYADGSIPTTSNTADMTLIGEANNQTFGALLLAGDMNADGSKDLIVGAYRYNNTNTGRLYIFYVDSSISTTAATADVIIDGESGSNNYFTWAGAVGDFNNDGDTDFVLSAYGILSNKGKIYMFYSQNGIVNTSFTITGAATNNHFGFAMTSGDFNADGRTDIAIGAYGHSSSTGRAYIFYNDGSIPTTAATADVTITGEATGDLFGATMVSGDFNADSKVDLAVGADGYGSDLGRAYIFYNDGSIPTTAATADVIITGENAGDLFGGNNINVNTAMTAGDFNADGRVDLAVGASGYSTSTGRAYIFYNDGSIPTTAATADVIITGENTSDYFGIALASGDLNTDGRIDLVVGAEGYSTGNGRAYIFYNDGSIPTTAATADVIITGTGGNFGRMLVTADMNTDGRIDLVASENTNTDSGSVFIFYNDGTYPSDITGADVTISGQNTNDFFGRYIVSGDFNADGRTDLAVGASNYSSGDGRAYIFYNDGSYPSSGDGADIKIQNNTGIGDGLGRSMVAGDFDSDGRMDLAIAARNYSTNTGQVYFYHAKENFSWTLQEQTLGTTRISPDVTGEELKITGETSSYFGYAMATGDLNADGKMDLVVGSSNYSSNTGRVYILYNDGNYPSGAPNADVVITGESSGSYFGYSLGTGDLNSDGKTDLAVGAQGYSSGTGRAYIFYNDGSIPTTAATADITITGESTADNFGWSLTSNDLNFDGTTDLIVGGIGYSSSDGRVYIFYNDGSIPTTAATADVIIMGQNNSEFGYGLATGDFNTDGRVDLVVGGPSHVTSTGRAYIFYNDGSIPTTAATADVIITGNATGDNFGYAITTGDFNADGNADLVVSGFSYSSSTGRVYIFYNDGSIPTTAATADITITGSSSGDLFGGSLITGDLNFDGKVDLVVGARGYSTSTGRAYIFYNDGSIPTTAATADVTLTGETTNNYFGNAVATGDLNADGRADLVVGAYGYASSKGRVYMYTFNDNVATGESSADYFGTSLATGDFNTDGKIDLVVGAPGYGSNDGRAYIFYNDGSTPTTAATADVIIDGQNNSYFGYTLTTGDLNSDGKSDLAVGASSYSSSTGRAYIFYNDGSIPTTAATADVTITGNATNDSFGVSLTTGDLNSDGKTDLAVGASSYSSSTGRAYIFYNDGSIPTTAATADVTITGNATGDGFGWALAVGDLNSDSKTDLAVGAPGYSSSTGRAYIFHNDGSIPTTAATADVTITGSATGDNFSAALVADDLDADGRTDLTAGAWGYNSFDGGVFILYNDGSIPTTAATADDIITGVTGSAENFSATYTGDLNADGKSDLIVTAWDASTLLDHAYIFYNDGSYPETASSADKSIAGEGNTDEFGSAVTAADFNTDGKLDLVVGAYGYSSSRGKVYTFISETEAIVVDPEAAKLKGIFRMKGNFNLK